jgi:serine/threonine protein kinase
MAAEFEPGQVFAGHRIDAVVGRGGMGIVYRATHLALDRPVALKVMAPDLVAEEGFRERFQRESRIAASLDHPHIVPVYHAGEQDGVLYITMRLIDGVDLRALLAQEGSFDAERAAQFTAQVASALDAAHARGLVHRDVKPANVLRAVRDGREHVYLTDFGLTKSARSTAGLTETGQWVGTLDYISPEQIRGDGVDARTDVYALGCVVYHELTGCVPFESENFAAKVWAHLNETPKALHNAAPGTPHALPEVVARAMAKDPGERYASAGEFAQAVNHAVAADGATRVRQRPAPPPEARTELERTPVDFPMVTERSQGPPDTARSQSKATRPSAAPPDPRRRKWLVRGGVLALLVAAAVVGGLAARGGGGGDPVDREDVVALLDRYQANLTNENLSGLERLMAPTFTRATLGDAPVNRQAALNQYRRGFAARKQPRVSLSRERIETGEDDATVRAQFLRTTPGRLALGDSGAIDITMVEKDGRLLIDSIHNYLDLIVTPPRFTQEQLPAVVQVEATVNSGGRRVRVAGGRNRLRANTAAIAFPLTPGGRRIVHTRQPIRVTVQSRYRGGTEPVRDSYTTAFER